MVRNATKNDLFLIGRNIYQSAVGHATSAVKLMSSLNSFLNGFKIAESFHIFNGMLYEVYFDSNDRFRHEKKTGCLSYLFVLEENDRFNISFEFIQKSLRPYEKELFYLPGTIRPILIDVKLDKLIDKSQIARNIFFNGDDVFYDYSSKELVSKLGEFRNWDYRFEDFENTILEKMATTRSRANFAYSTKDQNAEFIRAPLEFEINRITVK